MLQALNPIVPSSGLVTYEIQMIPLLRSSQITVDKSISGITKMEMSVWFVGPQKCSIDDETRGV